MCGPFPGRVCFLLGGPGAYVLWLRVGRLLLLLRGAPGTPFRLHKNPTQQQKSRVSMISME